MSWYQIGSHVLVNDRKLATAAILDRLVELDRSTGVTKKGRTLNGPAASRGCVTRPRPTGRKTSDLS
jgi:hypothetical protein